jgi:hypothetical protein
MTAANTGKLGDVLSFMQRQRKLCVASAFIHSR